MCCIKCITLILPPERKKKGALVFSAAQRILFELWGNSLMQGPDSAEHLRPSRWARASWRWVP